MPHELETKLNARATDIMDAILKGFRAEADVKGKLAEFYLARVLDGLKAQGNIDRYEWHDKDGKPDFEVHVGGKILVVECKNVRAGAKHGDAVAAKVELQKTRNGEDAQGQKTRGYTKDHFDLLAACTFNQTGHWNFRFISSLNLQTRPNDPGILTVMQPVPYLDEGGWTGDLAALINVEIARGGGRVPAPVVATVPKVKAAKGGGHQSTKVTKK